MNLVSLIQRPCLPTVDCYSLLVACLLSFQTSHGFQLHGTFQEYVVSLYHPFLLRLKLITL